MRTGRELDRRREEKWQACWCCRDQQRACRMAQALAERAVGKYARAAFAKRKGNRAVGPKHQIMREKKVKVSESRTLAREMGIRARAWRGEGGLLSEGRRVPRRRGRASNKSLSRGSRRKHERVSGRKSSPGRSAEFWFYSKSSQSCNRNGGWETKSPLIR